MSEPQRRSPFEEALDADLAALFSRLRANDANDDLRDIYDRLTEMFERDDPLQQHKRSFKALNKMQKEDVSKQDKNATCAICIDNLCNAVEIPEDFVVREELKTDVKAFKTTVVVMPCKHRYHYMCLTLWLEKQQTCPTCRQKLKTDAEYEEEERQRNIEELHDSMYS